jgi:hypothetical protein
MSPSEFMETYRHLTVTLEGGKSVIVDVHAYLINESGPHSAIKALAMWDQVKEALAAEVHRKRPGNPGQLLLSGVGSAHGGGTIGAMAGHAGASAPADRHAFQIAMIELRHTEAGASSVPYGKGTPEAIAQYLQLAVKAKVTTPQTLQKFADDRYVGLDCSGFVSAYFKSVGNKHQGNAQSFAVGRPKRMTLDTLDDRDVMVWTEDKHVALLEGPACDKDGTESTVVESNGERGLGSETYQFLSVDKNGVFTVERENGERFKTQVFDWNL